MGIVMTEPLRLAERINLLVYNYSGNPMSVDLTKISGAKKKVWWYSPKDGKTFFYRRI